MLTLPHIAPLSSTTTSRNVVKGKSAVSSSSKNSITPRQTSPSTTDTRIDQQTDTPSFLEEFQRLFFSTSSSPSPCGKHFIFFALQVLCAGLSLGFIGTFVYILVKEKQSSSSSSWDLSLCRTFLSIGAIAMYYHSKPILESFRAPTVFVACLWSLGVNCLLLSLLDVLSTGSSLYWVCLLTAEALRGATFAILWTGVVVYTDQFSPKGGGATMVSLTYTGGVCVCVCVCVCVRAM